MYTLLVRCSFFPYLAAKLNKSVGEYILKDGQLRVSIKYLRRNNQHKYIVSFLFPLYYVGKTHRTLSLFCLTETMFMLHNKLIRYEGVECSQTCKSKEQNRNIKLLNTEFILCSCVSCLCVFFMYWMFLILYFQTTGLIHNCQELHKWTI